MAYWLLCWPYRLSFFFFNDTATTEIYTLSLHDALPISVARNGTCTYTVSGTTSGVIPVPPLSMIPTTRREPDRKSTRLNSSHLVISYAVFCLKKKQKPRPIATPLSTVPLPAC